MKMPEINTVTVNYNITVRRLKRTNILKWKLKIAQPILWLISRFLKTKIKIEMYIDKE